MLVNSVPASLGQMEGAAGELDQYLRENQCPENLRIKLEIAFEELFTNIASYAYEGETGRISYACYLEEEEGMLVIQMKDRGKPFNPLTREEPDFAIPFEERPEGGLGIHLVKKLADDIRYRYEDGFNILTLKMRLSV